MKIQIERSQLIYLIAYLKAVLKYRENYELRKVLDVLELELDTGEVE
jgi:hypothetical protein